MGGTILNDIVSDNSEDQWLLNAIQAAGGVIAEETMAQAVPELMQSKLVLDDAEAVTTKIALAKELGLISNEDQIQQVVTSLQMVVNILNSSTERNAQSSPMLQVV